MNRKTRPKKKPGGSALPWMMSVLDAMPRNVALLDALGIIVAVNGGWKRFAAENGLPPAWSASGSGVGVDYPAICDAARGSWAEGAEEAAAGIRAVLARQASSFTQDYPCHSPDRQRWFAMTVLPLDHPAAAAMVIHADITARKREELRRHDVELRLQLALDATGDGLWDWDLRSGRAYLSPGYYALAGYRPEDEPGSLEFFQRLVHQDDWPHVMATIEAHLRGETPVSEIEYRMIAACGTMRWISGRGRVVEWDAAGVPVRMIGLVTDITAYKNIERSLQDSEARYRDVVEAQTEIIGRVTADGTILFANETYLRFFGKTADEVIGRRWQPVAHPDDLPMIEARLGELSAANPVVVVENRVFAGDGSLRWMQFINHGFFDAAGRLKEVQAVGRDVTERRELEEHQRRLLEDNHRLTQELMRLQERERAALAKELHDELSQQLVAIRAYSGAIRRRVDNPKDKTYRDASAIGSAASDIYAISHRLMEGLHPQVLDSAGLVAAITSLVSRWSQAETGVRFRLRATAIGPCSAEVRIHLYRIVQECLTNAMRHGRARRVRIFVGERRTGRRRRLRIVVRDDGVGMPESAAHAGFGLILMRERVLKLGGRLDLRTSPGRGLRVALDVPLGAAT